MGLFDSLGSLVKDVAEVALAPVEIAVDVVGAVVKPVAEAAEQLKNDVKDLTK